MAAVPKTREERRCNSASEMMSFPGDCNGYDPNVGLAKRNRFAAARRDRSVRRSSTTAVRKFSPIVSTEEYHKDENASFNGPYAHLRREIDYTYHCKYRKERQWLQDSIIESIIEESIPKESNICINPTEPWLLCTVGSRGAGKKHVLNYLTEDGTLPLLSFVRVDPDEIRRRLPEFDSYSYRSPHMVDELTRKESGFIAEILLLAALQAGRNVIFDGSMRDVSWHIKLVEKLRVQYPSLKFGILNITASTETILARGRKKYTDTGREITQDHVVDDFRQIEESVDAAKPFFDFHCKIFNDDGPPQVLDMDWSEFQMTFMQACAWKPGMNGKQKRRVSVQESEESRRLSIRRAGMRNKRFSVCISSEENNRSEDLNFYGKFSHIRRSLDYNYHSNYTFERQKLQDAIIGEMLDAAIILDKDGKVGSVPTEPWIVFTAGAMGAGKSHTMNTLVEKGYFPLQAFVIVDPDEIRRLLPEYHMYIDENPELAGELTRKEAGFIAEILTLAALQGGKNVLQDGSLRDSEWYQSYFARLRDEFPSVRQAILHVTAPREAVFQRAAERALRTGRIVPQDVLEKALEQVPRSVKILAPLVDFYGELNNAAEVELTKPEDCCWEEFRLVWIQQVAYEVRRSKFLRLTGKCQKQLQLVDGGTLAAINE